MLTAVQLLFVIFLVFANGFFVAAEFALVKVRTKQIDVLAGQNRWTAKLTKTILSHMDVYLSACQLGITLASLGLGWMGEPLVAAVVSPVLEKIDFLAPYEHFISFALGFTIITFLHITVGEQAPKILAIQKATPVSLAVSGPLVLFYQLLRPAIWVLNASSNLILRTIGLEVISEHDQAHSEEELRLILAESAAGGSLTLGERRLMENVLDLEEKTARQIMLPRQDIVFLDIHQGQQENLKIISESDHTRFPVCDGNLDRIIGVLHVKTLLQHLIEEKTPQPIAELATKMPIHPESIRLNRLLREFLDGHTHMAILVNEFGSVTGMVTLEDVIEEIVGQIQDEFDRELPALRARAGGCFLAEGTCPLSLVSEKLGLDLSHVEAETVGGLLSERLERIPQQGDQIELGGYRFLVRQATSTRAEEVEICPVSSADDRPPKEKHSEAPANAEESHDRTT